MYQYLTFLKILPNKYIINLHQFFFKLVAARARLGELEKQFEALCY